MKHFFQYVGAGVADWFKDRWLDLRAWAVLQWSKLHKRNTGGR